MPAAAGSHAQSTAFRAGAYAILSTPFHADEALDEDGLSRLTAFYEARGAEGLVALAVMGEGAKLEDEERGRAIRAVLAGRESAPVCVGVSAPASRVVCRRIEAAADLGAASVLLSPSAGMDGEAIFSLFAEAGRVGLPIVLQDHPQSSGVALPAALIGRILAQVEAVQAVKNEAPPSALKARQVLDAAGARPFTLLGGLGALSLLDELDSGSDGTMTGFAYPEVLTAIVAAYGSGDRERARRLYERFLPWLVFEATAAVSLAIRKEFLRLRGVIGSAVVRGPGGGLETALGRRAAELDQAFAGAARAAGLFS
jgi:4-hydroxy-tetrahydrodipicolinate synthase